MVKKVAYTILTLLLSLGFWLRTHDLSNTPPALYWDEMDVGYQAYSILKTGKDYFGNYPLLTIHSFADFRAPMLIYATIPFVALFDLSALSVRMPAAVMGTVIILLMYLLSMELFKDRKIALVVAALSAFAPWGVQYSRIAFESTLMLAFFLGGLICFFKGLQKSKWFVAAAIFFSLDLFTYNTSKLFLPLILLSLGAIYFRKLVPNKNLLIGITIFGLSFITSLYGTIFLNGGQRFAEISILTDPQTSAHVDFLRNQSKVSYDDKTEPGEHPRALDKLIYNKLTLQLDTVSQNYLSVFSSNFLFIRGDPNLRHSTSVFGEFYRIESLTILLGLAFILFKLKEGAISTGTKKSAEHFGTKSAFFLLVWIAISPLAAVITREGGNHATRLFFLFPVLTITSALGFKYLWSILPGKINWGVISLVTLIWVFSILSFTNFYFGAYNLESARAFQYGFNEAATQALKNKNSYEYVIIDDKRDSALMNYLFLSKYNPAEFQSQVKSIQTKFLDFDVDKLGNIIFMKPKPRDWENIFRINLVDKNYLLIISSEQLNEESPEKVAKKLTPNQQLLDVIHYKAGNPAFYVISSKKPAQI